MFNPREGNDLYLVYNHGINTDRYRDIPPFPFTDNRAVMIISPSERVPGLALDMLSSLSGLSEVRLVRLQAHGAQE